MPLAENRRSELRSRRGAHSTSPVHRMNPRQVQLFQPVYHMPNRKFMRKNSHRAIEIAKIAPM